MEEEKRQREPSSCSARANSDVLLDAARLAGRTHTVPTAVRSRRRCRPRSSIPVHPATHLRAVAGHPGPARRRIVQTRRAIDASGRSRCGETDGRKRETRCQDQEPNCHTEIPHVSRNATETLRQPKLSRLVPRANRPFRPSVARSGVDADVSGHEVDHGYGRSDRR